MSEAGAGRILEERRIGRDGETLRGHGKQRGVRSITVNTLESPLGWLLARKLVTRRQFDAGEQLRGDWERASLSRGVTMNWTSAPMESRRGGSAAALDHSAAQIDARRRFDCAIAAAGPGLADILWRVVCSGEGMRDAETALGWPARAGKLVLVLALDRVADYYRIR
ncbi:DUF6456 domain-containing protein [Sphingomonas sinipercae]|uniref:DUF6456 domain-containing protein n=1 Tax=Sphingomonas sinipercae TaxID=2714944 RepID=UPI001FE79DB0|nr:DUF6456 domain-containing protein [Sphingomonas sinipercae]